MENVIILEKELKKHFDYNWERVRFLSQFTLALIDSKSVNLSLVADNFRSKAETHSTYRRIQKFFKDFDIDYTQTAEFLSNFIEDDKWILAIDRTCWMVGSQEVNVLMLAVSYQGMAIPLIWELLTEEDEKTGKKGNSHTKDRKNIIDKFISIFGKDKIKAITADREFIGEDWFEYLISSDLPFVIRIKKNFIIEYNQEIKKAYKFFNKEGILELTDSETLGKKLDIVGKKLEDDYLILATNLNIKKNNIFDIYSKRWGIETMFGAFKSKGFNLEDTKLKDLKKIKKLLALLSITFVWIFKIGEFMHIQEPIPFKKN
jgi:hypothetical protein